MKTNPFNRISLLILGLCLSFSAVSQDFSGNDELRTFIQDMSSKHDFDQDQLHQWFSKTQLHQSIIDAISRPAESKPWYEYRPIFVTRERTSGGVRFWNENQAALKRAEKEFGVPPQIITAIIGVETRYGKHAGR